MPTVATCRLSAALVASASKPTPSQPAVSASATTIIKTLVRWCLLLFCFYFPFLSCTARYARAMGVLTMTGFGASNATGFGANANQPAAGGGMFGSAGGFGTGTCMFSDLFHRHVCFPGSRLCRRLALSSALEPPSANHPPTTSRLWNQHCCQHGRNWLRRHTR